MRNRSNENNYHWDYREYQGNYGQNPARRSNSRGLKIFLITMGVVVLLVGALCIGASAWSHKNPQPENRLGDPYLLGKGITSSLP